MKKTKTMHIIHVATEFAPFAKVGGLADVVASLSRELQKKNYHVAVILPRYTWIEEGLFDSWKKLKLSLVFFEKKILLNNDIFEAKYHGITLYFVDTHHPKKYFSRDRIYGYEDDFFRFVCFSKAAFCLIHLLKKKVDILHLHDWHTASMVLFHKYLIKSTLIKKVILTVHNFAYQGRAKKEILLEFGLQKKHLQSKKILEKTGEVNLLKAAISHADAITTVSPTYAKEVLTSSQGFGLEKVLRKHRRKFFGILNGLDISVWDPSKDVFLKTPYSFKKDVIKAKKENKAYLQKKFSLEKSKKPLFAFIGRLVEQKGPDLIAKIIPFLLKNGAQIVICSATSVKKYQKLFEKLDEKYKDNPNIHFYLKYSEQISRQIYGAADFILVPSIFEPCGLIQLIAMRYGAFPIVYKTGGLADTVFDIDDTSIPALKKNGFVFTDFKLESFKQAVLRALQFYKTDKPEKLIVNNMKKDFSWEKSLKEYERLYRKKLRFSKSFFQKLFVR